MDTRRERYMVMNLLSGCCKNISPGVDTTENGECLNTGFHSLWVLIFVGNRKATHGEDTQKDNRQNTRRERSQ